MNREELKAEGELRSCPGEAAAAPRNYQDPDEVSYEPIDTVPDLLDYGVKREIVNGVVVEVETRDPCVLVEKTIPMSTAFSDIKIQVNGRRFRNKSCPKTLVCHDLNEGYGDDKFVFGRKNPKNYCFRHWLQTDIFCYFSHHFVTIPPLGWINAAHKHGVQCIGTIITEDHENNKKGSLLCEALLADRATMEKAVTKLCMVAEHYGFDGYLLNFENGVKKIEQFIDFVSLLRQKMKSGNPNAILIWYDALTVDGRNFNQNELNEKNKVFFDICDGIYLNYDWNESSLLKSLEQAAGRDFDVFVGVDVYGFERSRCGIGGLRTYERVKMAADCGLSVAIFAPAWSFERNDFDEFPHKDNELWMRCAKYFYFRTLKVTDANETEEVDGGVVSVPTSGKYQVLISTDFCLGVGRTEFRFGKEPACKKPEDCSWFNLNKQSYQPALNCFPPEKMDKVDYSAFAQFDSARGFLGGCSLKIPAKGEDEIEHSSPLWIPLDVSLGQNVRNDAGTKYAVLAMVAWRSDNLKDMEMIDTTGSNHPIKIFLELMQPSLTTIGDSKTLWKVVRLSNTSEKIGFQLPKDPVTIHLKDFITKSQSQEDSIPDVSLVFKNAPYAEADLNDWKISCFMMDMNMNHCNESNITALRLGAVTPVNVGLLSLALLSY